ncbi:MAG: HAMP domain-containing protein [Deltaproteobacteria bacterium]|nr:HAMP domain-containing protein [Deltaproteobacteria bacterium]
MNLKNLSEFLGFQTTTFEESPSPVAGRPLLGIRTRITLGFFICFLMALGITLISLYVVVLLKDKLHFLQVADNFSVEIQQARRFEKNYFLYGTNLSDAASHVNTALSILQANVLPLKGVIGKPNYDILVNHTETYQKLLENLQTVDKDREKAPAAQRRNLESDLRIHGGEMISLAFSLVQKERQTVEEMLQWSRRVPIFFLIFLFLLMIYLAHLLSRQILAPLNKILKYTQRIAKGDYTPEVPSRPYRDEFSDLLSAIDRMLEELAHRQEILIQSHKLRAVGTLTAGVAHELNNPINNISLTAHMLLEEYQEISAEDRKEMILDLIHQADRSRSIVRNLLDFARESESKIESLDLGALIQETSKLAGNQIKMAGVHLDVSILPNLPRIHGDHQQLSQVFLNILLNALDVIPKGGRIQISVAHEDPNFVAAKITDNGPGIPEHILPNIFDPFFTTKIKGKGTGLGLSVSQGIIARHGGQIRVSSKEGVGTTFTIILPVTTIPALELSPKSE